MEFILSAERHLVAAAILTFLVFLYSLLLISRNILRNTSNKRAAPEAGGAWPMIGHLHLLGGPEPSHRVLGNMADKYGPIFTIRMGVHRALVVSQWEIAKECFTTNDRAFADRPRTMAMELLGYNFSIIGFSPYGHYWRQSRRIVTLELLSNHRLEKLQHVLESEVKASIKWLHEPWVNNKSGSCLDKGLLVEMKRWLEGVTHNIILRIVIGKRFTSEEGEIGSEWKEQLTKFLRLSGKFVVSDALPFLRWIDIGGDERLMKKTAKEFDNILQGWLEEHKRKRISGEEVNKKEDFIDAMLSILEDDPGQFPDRDADTINKAICMTLILAATDTTTVTLTWALSLLLNHRDVLRKVQNELDIQVGSKRQRQVNEADIKDLVYLQAIIKETLRLYPAVPLLIPHESIEDCTVSGYHIPAGTRLFVNAWKLHRDPRVWEGPCEFQPERFLTTHKEIDVRGQNFELIPFSSGRRMCPGVSFSLKVMHLILAHLLHGFDLTTPSDEAVDMKEGMALTLAKATPLEVLLTPRLSASLYD